MSMVFRFRMLSDENDHFVRDYEVLYDTTLLEFHRFILQSLEYEECMASFYTADERWEKLREFTLMEMRDTEEAGPETMESITLGQIIHRHRDRLIYLFDMFGDRAYYLELTGVYEADKGAAYPREIYARAEAPDQYDPSKNPEDDEDDESAYAEIMDEFKDFEGDDNYDDEY
ncbi:MAG TPA: plasmid pRiA4b ORF-3 family protein [Candidatus Alistipes faecavium]|nr:plasmid pRiA4b ORF-3 family protein [Candidatus Alistipes faecavium]